jgi:thiol-disulfide isomerase/thioredoxin
MMLISIGLGVTIAVILITVVSLLTGGEANSLFTPSTLDGTKLPALGLPGLTAGTVDGPWTKGHPAVVVFFASWCAPCKEELPRVARWEEGHDLGAVRFIGVDSNDQRSSGRAFARSSGVAFPSGFDEQGTVTASAFSIENLPDTVFVDAAGRVAHLVVGSVTNRQLAAGVAELN